MNHLIDDDYIPESDILSNQEQNEINYNCSECYSEIEILSINENECSIEFQCINNNHKKKMLIKDYINKMSNFKNKNINLNNDICITHNLKYECYCLDCKKHLCKDCLKLRNHVNHLKNIILEIQPNKKELNIYENIIENYNNKIENLEREKININKEINKNKAYNIDIKEIDKNINNLKDIKRLNDIIYNTYNNYNNNYYNSINIHNMLINYKQNNFNKELNNLYENIIKIRQENKIKNEYENKIKEIENEYNKKIKKLKTENQINTQIIKKEYKDGRYEGEFKNDKKSGKKKIFKDDDDYEEDYKIDKREGKGTFYYNNGDKYEGEWKNDKKEAKEFFIGKMEIDMKENLKMINLMDMEYFIITQKVGKEIGMKDIGEMIKEKANEFIFIMMEMYMKEIGKMIMLKEKGSFIILMVIEKLVIT